MSAGFAVVYRNVLDGREHVLLTALEAREAAGILARFGDRSDPSRYLPGLRITTVGSLPAGASDGDAL